MIIFLGRIIINSQFAETDKRIRMFARYENNLQKSSIALPCATWSLWENNNLKR
jgi:hypothetical protein